MRKMIFLSIMTLMSPSALAQYNMMGGNGMMSGYGGGLTWLLYFAILSFVFSVIFWLTYNWLSGKKR